MRTHLEFRSDQFPGYGSEVEGVNYHSIWGKRLAEYLAARLRERGLPVEEPFAEDWGWLVPIRNDAFPLFVGCASYGESGEDGFACFIEPSRPELRRWLKKIDTRETVERVAEALEAILTSDPGIRGFRWWSEAETPR